MNKYGIPGHACMGLLAILGVFLDGPAVTDLLMHVMKVSRNTTELQGMDIRNISCKGSLCIFA